VKDDPFNTQPILQTMNTTRRQLLKGAGALSSLGALAALGSPTAAFAKNANEDEGPEGSWLYTVTITDSDPPFTELGLETYAAGGGYVGIDQLSFTPGSLATPGHGSWKSTGKGTFLLTFLNLTYDAAGTPQGTSKVRQVATLSEDGNAYSGSGSFDGYDVSGNVIFSGAFTITAVRIAVEKP
jgi:hypothetical protein